MRIMALDYGTRTVGVAVSDELLMTARAVETIFRKDKNKLRRTYARIEELVKELSVTEIVVGLPLNMDMSMSEMAVQATAFKDNVARRTGLPVILFDERLTSVEATEILRLNGIRPADEKKYIDMVAAKIILESYLAEKEYRQA